MNDRYLCRAKRNDNGEWVGYIVELWKENLTVSVGNQMEKVAEKVDTHIVIKKDDAMKYLEKSEQIVLDNMLNKISQCRMKDKKKPFNHYHICNEDEPYADIVRGVILGGEAVKAKLQNMNIE